MGAFCLMRFWSPQLTTQDIGKKNDRWIVNYLLTPFKCWFNSYDNTISVLLSRCSDGVEPEACCLWKSYFILIWIRLFWELKASFSFEVSVLCRSLTFAEFYFKFLHISQSYPGAKGSGVKYGEWQWVARFIFNSLLLCYLRVQLSQEKKIFITIFFLSFLSFVILQFIWFKGIFLPQFLRVIAKT